jgi:hypothetical protein
VTQDVHAGVAAGWIPQWLAEAAELSL